MEQQELSVQVVCPNCGATLLVKNKTGAWGRLVNCPKCQQPITVNFAPAPQLAPSAPVAEPVSSSQPQKRGGASSSKGLLIGVLSGLVVVLAGLLVWLLVLKDNPSNTHAEKTEMGLQSSARPQAVNNKTFTVNGVSFTMVEVEGGTFTMGATSEQGNDYDSDEKPTHHVTLSSFYIGQTEVTHALWHAVMGGDPIDLDKANMPVEFVSWDDCQVFVRKLSSLTGEHFRLPTESEWEYAARGGNRSRGYKYSGSNNLGSVAWYHKNSGEKPHNVATKQPNELDIYDMSGNVWEWCQDWLGDYDSSSQFDPTGPAEGTYRVHRGGCFTLFEAFDDKSWTCRVSARHGCTPEFSDFYVGLRLAL